MALWLKQDDGTLAEVSGGVNGEDGQPGTDGIDGLPGADGNMWHVGSGEPSPTLGEVGDYYLDGEDGWVYVKRSNSAWTNLFVNLTGPPGTGGGGGDFLPLTGGTLTGDLTVDMDADLTISPYNMKGIVLDRTANPNVPGLVKLLPSYRDGHSSFLVEADGNQVAKFSGDKLTNLYGGLQVDGQVKATNGGSKDAPAFQIRPDKALGMFGSIASQWIRFSTDGEYRFQIGTTKATAYNDLQVVGKLIVKAGGGATNSAIGFDGIDGMAIYSSVQNNYMRFAVAGAQRLAIKETEVVVNNDLQVGGQIKAQNGSAAAPAYSFTSAPNAGMWYDTGSQKGIRLDYDGKNAIYIRAGGSIHPGIFMKGVYDSVMNGYATSVGVTSAGQLVRLASFNRSDIKETEAVSHAATNNVYDLQPVWFRSTSNTDNPEHSYYGLIADDCAAIDPRLATYRADEDGVEVADDVNTDAVVALLVSAVKSQRDTITDLTARIEELEGQKRPIR